MLRRLKKINYNRLIKRTYKKLQYISNLNLEYNTIPTIPVKADYLALLGDIGNPFSQAYDVFLRDCSKKWNKVLLLSGNNEFHSFSHMTMDMVTDRINSVVQQYNNVHYLNNSTLILDNYKIIGSTLWSAMTCQTMITDDVFIKNNRGTLTIKDFNKLHDDSVHFINNNIFSNEKVIVLTHFLPSYSLITGKYNYPKYKIYHQRLASHLDYLIKPPITHWLSGHSRVVLEKTINGVYCGINSFRYRSNNTYLVKTIDL